MLRPMALMAAVVSGAMSVQAAFAQSATKLSEICGDCKVEKVASCGAGKFLEGPNFDRDGVLWMVGLMAGEVLKVSKDGQCTVAKTGLNFPGGTRFDKEGKLIITTRSALVSFDTRSSELTTLRSLYGTQGFRGLNDVIVDKQGGIYFTEPNGSSVIRPIGRVYYMPPSRSGELQLIGDTFAFPNGIVLSPDETILYVGEYAMNRITGVPLSSAGMVNPGRVPWVFATMAGGIGPDGMLVDSKGNVYTAHYMAGEVVVHDRFGFQIGVIKLPADAGMGSTNIVFRDGYLYITEALKNDVWRVPAKIPPT
jgi:gluconolactonase